MKIDMDKQRVIRKIDIYNIFRKKGILVDKIIFQKGMNTNMNLCTIDESALNYLFETDSLCIVDNIIYFSAKNYDALISINLEKHIAMIEKCFLGRYNTSYCAHSKIICYGHNIFCIPRYSKHVIKYDLITKQSSKIEIPNIKDEKSVFSEAVQIDDRIICFPEFYEGIAIIDMKTSELLNIKELRNDTPNQYLFSSKAVQNEKVVLIPFYNKSKILEFDTIHNTISFIDLEVDSVGFVSIACLNNKIYLIGTDCILYVVDHDGKLLAVQKNVNGMLYTIDNLVWLIDKIKNDIYIVKMNEVGIEHYKIGDDHLAILKNSKWIKSESSNGFIYILIQRENLEMGIFRCNAKEEYYDPIDVETLCEELYRNKCLFAEHFEILLPLFKTVLSKQVIAENKVGDTGSRIFIMTKE